MKPDHVCPRGRNLNIDILPTVPEEKEVNTLANYQMNRLPWPKKKKRLM